MLLAWPHALAGDDRLGVAGVPGKHGGVFAAQVLHPGEGVLAQALAQQRARVKLRALRHGVDPGARLQPPQRQLGRPAHQLHLGADQLGLIPVATNWP